MNYIRLKYELSVFFTNSISSMKKNNRERAFCLIRLIETLYFNLFLETAEHRSC